MDTLSMITDRYGPRLTGSVEAQEAADWTVERLKGYGLRNVHLEAWGPFGRNWELQEYSLEMVEPRYSHLRATPLAWTRSTTGTMTAEPILAPVARTFSPRRGKTISTNSLSRTTANCRGRLCCFPIPILFRRRQILCSSATPTPISRKCRRLRRPRRRCGSILRTCRFRRIRRSGGSFLAR